MKIRLVNFLCYDDSTFEFGNKGITLISGQSGTGKTSIMRGIFFALFGEGTKLISINKTSCKVELYFDGMKIVRTKRPNVLVLNDMNEDEEAQSIINEKFGLTFKTSGYIQQNNLNSFILLSPLDKLGFLEKFAFDTADIEKIKEKSKELIVDKNKELISVVSQLNTIQDIVKEIDIPDKVVFPVKCKKTQTDLVIKNENIKYKNTFVISKKLEKTKERLNKELVDLNLANEKINSKNYVIQQLESQLQDCSDLILKYKGLEYIKLLDIELKSIISNREYEKLKQQLKSDSDNLLKIKNQEMDDMRSQISKIDKEIWKEYTKYSIDEEITIYQECFDDMNKVKSLSNSIPKIQVDVDSLILENSGHIHVLEDQRKRLNILKIQKECYECPNCEAIVRLIEGQLQMHDTKIQVSETVEDITQKIRELDDLVTKNNEIISVTKQNIKEKEKIESLISELLGKYEETDDLEDIKSHIDYLNEYKRHCYRLEKIKIDLENDIGSSNLSPTFKKLKSYVESLKTRIQNIETVTMIRRYPDLDESEIRQELSDQKEYDKRIKDINDSNKKINNQLIIVKSELENIESNRIDKDTISVENSIIDVETQISENLLKRKEQEKKLSLIDKWQQYNTDLKKYNDWQSKLQIINQKHSKCKKEYSAALLLKDKILESESVFIINIIESINSHARVYLDSFFVENPISVNLRTFKQTKKNIKPKINVVVEYKGIESDLTILSGGELARVILAFTLSLAEMFNTPLLLLDECTSSLDQDSTELVFNGIKEHFKGKLTLLIAHQVINGSFDKIVSLEN